MDARLIVDLAHAAAAQARMVQAIQAYREAVDTVKAAADDIASKWEGEAKEAFVENEQNAYGFYIGISQVALGACEAIKQIISQMEEDEGTIKGIVSR